MGDDNYLSWFTGMTVMDPRPIGRFDTIVDNQIRPTVTNPPFGGIEIKVSDHMPADQILMLPNGEAVMGHAKYAELIAHVQKRMDDGITEAMLGGPTKNTNTVEPKPDPEKEAMQNSELWGAF